MSHDTSRVCPTTIDVDLLPTLLMAKPNKKANKKANSTNVVSEGDKGGVTDNTDNTATGASDKIGSGAVKADNFGSIDSEASTAIGISEADTKTGAGGTRKADNFGSGISEASTEIGSGGVNKADNFGSGIGESKADKSTTGVISDNKADKVGISDMSDITADKAAISGISDKTSAIDISEASAETGAGGVSKADNAGSGISENKADESSIGVNEKKADGSTIIGYTKANSANRSDIIDNTTITTDHDSNDTSIKTDVGTKGNSYTGRTSQSANINKVDNNQRDDINTNPVNTPNPSTQSTPSKPKKAVGFAALPEEDLTQHHKDIKKKEAIRAESNSFHKIPPELAYLQRRSIPIPKPIIPENKPVITKIATKELGDLKKMPIKVISVQNQNTEINFDYSTIKRPIQAKSVLVDVKYAGLNSRDLFKIYQFGLNVSNKQIGLGYEFVGIILDSNHQDYIVGDTVVGLVDPSSKQGSLSTSLLLYPGYDHLIVIDNEYLERLKKIDIKLKFDVNSFEIDSDDSESIDIDSDLTAVEDVPKKKRVYGYEISDTLDNLGKLVSFPSLYCRSMQILSHLTYKNNGKLNILINGADTNLGFTLIQIIFSQYTNLNLILIVREELIEKVHGFIRNLNFDSNSVKVIAFDSSQDELQIPGARVASQYKKPEFFATEILDALFSTRIDSDPLIDFKNIVNYQLDLFIDLIGNKKMFQPKVKFDQIDEINLPFKAHLKESVSTLFSGQVKEPFFFKLLKPKASGSAFVSACKFETKRPSYAVHDLYQQASTWGKLMGNTFTGYNWFEEIDLKVKSNWLQQGLELLLDGQLKFDINHVLDWRNKVTKTKIKELKESDRKLVLKIEDY